MSARAWSVAAPLLAAVVIGLLLWFATGSGVTAAIGAAVGAGVGASIAATRARRSGRGGSVRPG